METAHDNSIVAGARTAIDGSRIKPGDQIIGLVSNSSIGSILRVLEGLPVYGVATITAGGTADDLTSILPDGCRAVIRKTLNGIGMIVVVPGWKAGEIAQKLEWHLAAQKGDKSLGGPKKYAFQIGDIKEGEAI